MLRQAVLAVALFAVLRGGQAFFLDSITGFDSNHFISCGIDDPSDYTGLTERCCKSDLLPDTCSCFDITVKTGFINSVFFKPECPSDLDVKFYYYDREHNDTDLIISAGNASISATPFSSSRPTKIVVHGFCDYAPMPWMVDMKNELLKAYDLNVILVDWQKGAAGPNYAQAVANTRTVGALIGKLVEDLNLHTGAEYKDFHLIGHSLGSQIMGYAGKEVFRFSEEKVGRITGLDPAGPLFQGFSRYIHLDKEDAEFVDAIHSNGAPLYTLGLGMSDRVADVDFFPNGGANQPGCPKFDLTHIPSIDDFKNSACSHKRSYAYFTDSISLCRYNPTDADGKVDTKCTMGYHVDESCRGTFYPNTTADPATYFC